MTVVGVRAAHMHDARKRVERRLAKVGGRLSDSQVDQLVDYLLLLDRWNRRMNLTALDDPDAAVDRLVVEPVLAAARDRGRRTHARRHRVWWWVSRHSPEDREAGTGPHDDRGQDQEVSVPARSRAPPGTRHVLGGNRALRASPVQASPVFCCGCRLHSGRQGGNGAIAALWQRPPARRATVVVLEWCPTGTGRALAATCRAGGSPRGVASKPLVGDSKGRLSEPSLAMFHVEHCTIRLPSGRRLPGTRTAMPSLHQGRP